MPFICETENGFVGQIGNDQRHTFLQGWIHSFKLEQFLQPHVNVMLPPPW